MMQQKIEGSALPTLHTAASDFEAMGGDLDDVGAMLFALTDRSGDFEFDPRALRGAILAVEKLRDHARQSSAAFLEASKLARDLH